MRDADGEIISGGIGLVENALSWNPIVLSRSWEKVHVTACLYRGEPT